MDYTRQMRIALQFLESKLTSGFELEELAEIASFSMFHFHRMFTACIGYTPKDYIRRRRLSQAARELTFTNLPIIEIARRYQFESQASFTRAFKKQFGITPGKLRRSKHAFAYFYPINLSNNLIKKGGLTMDVKIVEKPALKIIGMKTITTMKNNVIPQLWDKFNQRWQEISCVAVKNACLGVCPYVDMKGFDEESEFGYIAGMIVENFDLVPEGMVRYEIPAQKYAVVTHKGTLDTLRDTYQYVYTQWLKDSEYEFAPTAELEWYDERFKFGEKDSELDIYIPIK